MVITYIVISAVSIAVIVALFIWMARRANKVDLIKPTDTQPEWMRNTPPKETIAATMADGEGVQIFGYNKGEAIASPFAEQIEDILQAKLDADPELKKYQVDLGTGADGQLTITINGTTYPDITSIPDERLKAIFNEAVEAWKKP